MGNVRGYKRVLAIVLAATVALVFSFSMSFAATSSPTTIKNQKGGSYGYYTLYTKTKTATMTGAYKKSYKTMTVTSTFTKKGKTYKITKVGDKAFSKCKKLKTLKIKSKYLKTFSTKAFKGWTKAHKKKLIVKINKNNKNKTKIKNALIKAGIPKKNIKFVKF